MPNEYHQTLEKLQKYITDDDVIADILGSEQPEDANKKILDCLIQKMENREQILDFCIQLEEAISSYDLMTIVHEIQKGNTHSYTDCTCNV